MNASRRLVAAFLGSIVPLVLLAPAACAQTLIDPSVTPTKNTGGWVYNMAELLTVLGGFTLVLLIVGYMRFAPRFAKDEEGIKVVRADRVRPGQELPRRAVDLSQAAPVVVAPPSIPVAAGMVAAPAPAAAPAAAAPTAPAAAAPTAAAPAAPPAAPVAAAPTAPAAAAPAAAAPAAPPAAPAAAAPSPAAPAPAAPAPAAPAPAAPAAPAERREVTLDQETYDKTLAELLEKGTDRRVAEGQAKRAGMIAARKKAEEG